MRNIKLTIQYDGSLFAGWQYQKDQITVQGSIMEALEEMLGESVALKGAGRTDIGVHAMGQVANFKTTKDYPLHQFRSGINHYVRRGIQISNAEEVGPYFHARFSAKSKTYRYYLSRERYLHPILQKYRGQYYGDLDFEKMEEASKILLGTHNFNAFHNDKKCHDRNHIRTLDELEIHGGEKEVLFIFKGESFLRNMIRILVGSLLEIGKGKRDITWLEKALESHKRTDAGPRVGAEGLYLWEIEYSKNGFSK